MIMGYITKDIAVITEPEGITLSSRPNFLQFASKPANKVYLECTIKVNITPSTPGDIPTLTKIVITIPSVGDHIYYGTTNLAEVRGNIFYVSAATSDTAASLRNSLLSDTAFSLLFDISLPLIQSGDNLVNGDTLSINSKGAGIAYNANIIASGNTGNAAYTITWIASQSANNDSISGESSTVGIEVDVYAGPSVFLGADDKPLTAKKMGRRVLTLAKTYSGVPLWFELNSLFLQHARHNGQPVGSGWFDPGTLDVYRIAARRKNEAYFYTSNSKYVVASHTPPDITTRLTEYVYDASKIITGGLLTKPLTNKPRTPFVKGQREYLNFLFADNQRDVISPTEYSVQVAYEALTVSGNSLGTIYGNSITRLSLSMVNTCILNIDALLEEHPSAGIVRVYLARGTTQITEAIEYDVRPDCLHTLCAFSFINRLGGWDTFNFDAEKEGDVSPGVETYDRTLTPDYKKGVSLETIYNTSLSDTFIVRGSPVSDAIAEWLKELIAARVILDGAGNSIIIDEFTLTTTKENTNMHEPQMRYHISK
jgi:hypothetical protein